MRFHLAPGIIVKSALAAMAVIVAQAASAQTAFPQKPVKIILPFAAGGASDVLTRQIAEGLRKIWQQPMIVDNRPGASGMIAIDIATKAEPDGYTAVLTTTAMVQAPVINGKTGFDPLKDLAPVSQVGTMPLAFVVRADSPLKSLADYVALAKATPGKVSYGSFGVGSAGHLYLELLQDAAKIQLLHAPYKGEQPTFTDLIGGQIDAAIVSVPGAKPLVDGHKLRALAVTGSQRTQQLPDTPSFPEAGFRDVGLESIGWYGILLPSKTPRDVIEKFSRDLNTVLSQVEFKEKMKNYGIDITGTTPEGFSNIIKSDYARWGKVIREKNIKAN